MPREDSSCASNADFCLSFGRSHRVAEIADKFLAHLIVLKSDVPKKRKSLPKHFENVDGRRYSTVDTMHMMRMKVYFVVG